MRPCVLVDRTQARTPPEDEDEVTRITTCAPQQCWSALVGRYSVFATVPNRMVVWDLCGCFWWLWITSQARNYGRGMMIGG